MPNVPITISGNIDESVNSLMKEMLTSTEKTNLAYAAAIQYADTLEEIFKESKETIRDCLSIQKKQAEVNGSKDGHEFLERWRPCQQEFLTLNAFVAAGVKKYKTVPPMSADIKAHLTPDRLKRLEATRDVTEKSRDIAKKAFQQTFKNHEDIKAYLKNIKEKIGEKKAVNSGASVSSNPSFSVYGSMQQASQKRAEEAKQQANHSTNTGQNNRREKK